jgi:hypothetical protein
MTRTCLAALAALGVLSLTGCGTVLNLASHDPQIYGGVLGDLTAVGTPRSSASGGGKGGAVVLALVFADACVSFAADTLTLPLVCFLETRNDSRSRPADPPPPQTAPDAVENPFTGTPHVAGVFRW